MTNYICVTCGTQFAATDEPPPRCPICEDERQYVNPEGQSWTTLEDLQSGYANILKTQEPGLVGIGTEPRFAIGQRALLVQTPDGNVLWDCISLIDEVTVEAIEVMGGIAAMAISHPHFYASMIDWSRTFGNAPIYLHADDRECVVRPDPAIVFWEGETQALNDSLTLVRCGGHFSGSTVMHWTAGANWRGALLTGDTMQVVADCQHVSFMYSYPNLIPVSAATVGRIVKAVEPFRYDRIYGGWFDRVILTEAKSAVTRSAARYMEAIEGAH